MQGKKQYLERPIISFRLSERVPTHNLYRRLDELLALTFLYDATDGSWLKIYWAAYQDCKQCPLKATCVPTAWRKQLTRTTDPAYRRAWARQQSRRGQVMRRRRQSTVEPVFGSLIHYYGLRRVNTRGKAGAHKTMLLAAVAYNLKKLLKHRTQQAVAVVLAMPRHKACGSRWRGVRQPDVSKRPRYTSLPPTISSSATATQQKLLKVSSSTAS